MLFRMLNHSPAIRSLVKLIPASNNGLRYQSTEQNKQAALKEQFLSVFEKHVLYDIEDSVFDYRSESLTNWARELLKYNVPHGKLNRGLSVVETYQTLVDPDNSKFYTVDLEEDTEAVMVLGWAVEIMQAYFVMLDDIMDQSVTRRGQPCWYKKVGFKAINDGIYLESCIYELVKRFFRKHESYLEMLHLLLDVNRITIIGQHLDMEFDHDKRNLANLTEERRSLVTEYKTSHYTLSLPVRLGMYAARRNDPDQHYKVEFVLLKIGDYFQATDDYLDCFGDPDKIGKVGTDIQQGKCCWPVVTALPKCDQRQRKVLEDNYGVDDLEAVARVKQVYGELDIKGEFSKFEETMKKQIELRIENIEREDVKLGEIVRQTFERIYGRQF